MFYVNKTPSTSSLHILSTLKLQNIFCKKVMLQQTTIFRINSNIAKLITFLLGEGVDVRGEVGVISLAVTYFFCPLLGGGLVDAPQIGRSYLLFLVLVFFLLTKVNNTQSQRSRWKRSKKVREELWRPEVTGHWPLKVKIMVTHVASSFFPS